MKITALRVKGFGRLRDREFAFGPGLTIVHGPNEAGKSTLHAALSASAFGLTPGGRRKPAHTAVIERHRPWQADRYASSLELERGDGRRVRLDWDFDRQSFAVIDAATGADLTSDHGAGTSPEVLTQTLHGVARDAYLRVGCVGQDELARIDGDASDVCEAIERAAGQSQAQSGSQAAVDRLRARRKLVAGLNRNQANPLPRAEAQVAHLRAELGDAIAARAEAEHLSAERDQAAEQTTALDRRIRGLEFALEGARWRWMRARVEKAETVEQQLVAASAVAQTSATLSAGFRPVPGVEGAREHYEHLLPSRTQLERDREEAQRALDQLRAPLPESPDPIAGPSPAGWIVAGAGAIAVVAGLVVSLILVLAGAVAVAAGAAVAMSARKAHARRIDEARAQRERAVAERREQAMGYEVELGKIAAAQAEFDSARARLATLLDAGSSDPEALAQSLANYAARAEAHVTQTEAERRRELARNELATLLGEKSLEQARSECLNLERTLNGHRNAPGADRDPADIESELKNLRGRREQTAVNQSGLAATAIERLRLVPDAGALQEQLDAAEEEVRRLQRAEAVLKLAESELEQTMAETYRDFAPRLNAALERNLLRATSGRYRTAYVADDLSVRLEAPETGAVIDVGQLSTGTQRLVYLVQRLELVQLIAPSAEPLPVLLDEPFAHLDPERMRAALEVLADLAGERQIVVFTTQSEAAEMAPPGTVVITL